MKKYCVIITSIIFVSAIGMIITPYIFSLNKSEIFSINSAEKYDSIVLFGAKVYSDSSLSPVMKQRADSAVYLFNKTKIKIIVTGNGRHEVDSICRYMNMNGIDDKNIIRDYGGLNTHKSVIYIRNYPGKNYIFVSQSFHLYRIMDMSSKYSINAVGYAAEQNHMNDDDSILVSKIAVRTFRHIRGALLFWVFRAGIYDYVSDLTE